MDKTLQIQTQIRQNAEEISTALSSMGKWEKEMKNRDGNIKAAHQKAVRVPRAPIRSGVGTVPVQDKENSATGRVSTGTSLSLSCFTVTCNSAALRLIFDHFLQRIDHRVQESSNYRPSKLSVANPVLHRCQQSFASERPRDRRCCCSCSPRHLRSQRLGRKRARARQCGV